MDPHEASSSVTLKSIKIITEKTDAVANHENDGSFDPKKNDEKGEKPFETIYGGYAQSTTIHGISPIYLAQNVYMRLFWLVIFACAFVLMSWNIWKLIDKLRRRDITTTVKTSYDDSFQFPAVTFCNTQGLVSQIPIMTFADILESMRSTGNTSYLGLKQSDFFLERAKICSFYEEACNFREQISRYFTGLFGYCFTFQADDDKPEPTKLYDGLFVAVNVKTDGYYQIDQMETFAKGTLVMVHSRNQTFTSREIFKKGIFIPPGQFARIAIKKRAVKQLPHPYPDNCYEKKFTDNLNGIQLRRPFLYTRELCRLPSEMQSRYHDQSSFTRESIELDQILPDMNVDKSLDPTRASDCRPPCEEEIFEYHTMLGPLRSTYGEEQVFKRLRDAYPKMRNQSNLNENVIAANVLMADFSVEKMEQIPAYDGSSFLSDLGGQLGLWIGASVYSGFELASILFQLFHHVVERRRRKEKVSGIPK